MNGPRPAAIAPFLSAQSRQLIIYHFVTAGRAYAQLRGGAGGDARREELSAGDVVVFPHGDDHFLFNGAAEPVDSIETLVPASRRRRADEVSSGAE